MAASGPRFCPRCGTGRVGDMGFCPNCGLDLRQLPADDRSGDAHGPAADDRTLLSPTADGAPVADVRAATRDRSTPERSILRPLLAPALLILLVVVAAAWVLGLGPFAPGGSGPLAGRGSGIGPTPSSPFLPPVTSQPSFIPSPGLTAPPVGLRILSPADGAVVGSREVTVIGTAPAGLRITQDISFGFDRHATADGTGHWAIALELSEGDNELKFRIGDDPSTAKTMHVIYVPPTP